MQLRVAVEDIEANHWVAYALDLPGCFSSAPGKTEAIREAASSIRAYFAWLSGHGVVPSLEHVPIETEVVATFRAFEWPAEPGYVVNAFFEDDRRPLSYWDVETALRLMAWTRQDLLAVTRYPREPAGGQVRSEEEDVATAEILRHVAGAENWYLGRLGLALEGETLPAEVFALLDAVRQQARRQLVRLVSDGRVVILSGEAWSPRKIVRRLLWHERDHTRQIAHLLQRA